MRADRCGRRNDSLLSAAFSEVKQAAKRGAGRGGKHNSGIILLIDEADALAQSVNLGRCTMKTVPA